MKLKFNTNLIPIFNGTYYTMWEISETDDQGNELEVEFNFKSFMKSIIEAYKAQTKNILTDLINATATKKSFIKNIRFINSFHSPQFYNFSTDTIDFTLTIDYRQLLKTLKDLEQDPAFKTFLKDNYSSRDGFISFTPDNYQELQTEIKNPRNNKFEQSLAAIINYLVSKNSEIGLFDEIEQDVYDYWQGNGYCGLNYKIITEEV